MKRRTALNVFYAILFIITNALVTTAQTREWLDAPVITSALPIQWESSDKVIQWLNADQPTTLTANKLFLSKGSVNITYPLLNPLRVRATASAKAAPDPSVDTISKLMDALKGIATTVAPPPQPPAALKALGFPQTATSKAANTLVPCDAADSAKINLAIVWGRLYKEIFTVSPKAKLTSWADAIDTQLDNQSGSTVIKNIRTEISADTKTVEKRIDDVTKGISRIRECAEQTSSTDRTLYIEADFSLSQSSATSMLSELKALLTQLNDELKPYEDSGRWVGEKHKDFKLNSEDITPTLEQMQNVTVKIVMIEFGDDDNGTTTIRKHDASSVTFTVRRYSLLVPEIGTGVVFGTIKKPTYGTDKNAAGQTIVSKTPDASISVNPSLMVNFVCHCSAGPLAPMFQIGAATSKDLPAILVGGGLRLFGLGKGDISLSGGGMLAWVKDLQKLKLGDVVNGTKDIEADLGYSSRPRRGGYIAILYKF